MKKGKQLTTDNMFVGQKIKVCINRDWAQTPYSKPYSRGYYCWVKGRVIEVCKNSIVVSTRYKWHKRCIHSFSNRLWICANESGMFNDVYLQLK